MPRIEKSEKFWYNIYERKTVTENSKENFTTWSKYRKRFRGWGEPTGDRENHAKAHYGRSPTVGWLNL